MKFSTVIKSALITSAFSLGGLTFAADIDMNADANDVAIHGYDTVAYFSKGSPIEGSAKYTATYKNAIYHFASVQNRDRFRATPDKYAPQYGGHCAMGVALEKKLDTDPTAWSIVDGKLYLNLNTTVQKKWKENLAGNLETAEEIWPEIKGKTAAELDEL